MLKRILFALALPALASGCIVERKPRVVQPNYVATCPEGYRYDGVNCRRVHHDHDTARVRIDARY